jgi:hypothetical protein
MQYVSAQWPSSGYIVASLLLVIYTNFYKFESICIIQLLGNLLHYNACCLVKMFSFLLRSKSNRYINFF